METFVTRVITIVALICFLVVGAAATSILGRDSVPMPRYDAASEPVVQNPISNKEGKKDRLAVVALAAASFEPPQAQIQSQIQSQVPFQVQAEAPNPELAESLRRAYASTTPADVGLPKVTEPAVAPAAPAPPKPKAASKPQPQKNYALLSDAQIAVIKERLKLSSAQESYWPAVEAALRAVARKIHATRQTDPGATGTPIDPDCAEVQQLKSAAMPLLFQLREDQKREVRSLARVIGLEKVAAMI
jgi:ABC-type transporter Mla MlaB component